MVHGNLGALKKRIRHIAALQVQNTPLPRQDRRTIMARFDLGWQARDGQAAQKFGGKSDAASHSAPNGLTAHLSAFSPPRHSALSAPADTH